MQLSYELAHRSVALRFENLPPQAVHSAKIGILDTVDVTVAGSVEPAARILGRVVLPTAGASRRSRAYAVRAAFLKEHARGGIPKRKPAPIKTPRTPVVRQRPVVWRMRRCPNMLLPNHDTGVVLPRNSGSVVR